MPDGKWQLPGWEIERERDDRVAGLAKKIKKT